MDYRDCSSHLFDTIEHKHLSKYPPTQMQPQEKRRHEDEEDSGEEAGS